MKKMRTILSRIADFFRRRNFDRRLKNTSFSDIIVAKDTKFYDRLLNWSVVLDRKAIDVLNDDGDYALGAFELSECIRLSLALSGRICRRLARVLAPNSPTEAAALEAAWFFAVWTEISVILPMRHLARFLHKKFGENLIVVPIDHGRVTCLNHWAYNELEPFILVAELRRRGARSFLLARSQELSNRFSGGKGELNFVANSAWWHSKVDAKIPTTTFEKVFEPDGMRDPHKVRCAIGRAALVGTVRDPASAASADIHLWSEVDNPPSIKVSFDVVLAHKAFSIFAPSDPLPKLTDAFLTFVGGLSKAAWENANKAVAASTAREAHVCDHLFFEGALISHAVAAAGGNIRLWPHSSNAGHVPFQKHDALAGVTAVTASAKRMWSRVLTSEIVNIDSSFMLSEASTARSYAAGEPVHIVVFAGAHRLNRMPTLDCRAHKAALQKFFGALAGLPDKFQVLVKPKAYWEEADWLEQFFPIGHRFRFTEQTTKELDLPNMIFSTVSLGSTALLEGIGRGIPGLIVREFPIVDYTALDAEHMQVGDTDFVIGQIRSCADPAYYHMLAEQHLRWYKTETNFPRGVI
ncbi:hypothetical protein ACXHXM_01145|uniref:hypothetical protein n=1 Tax=Rhizobium altiplani TaxID=1864509 RepID=UPI001041D4DE|nr:hypothetical protein [Rhizobium altiplani]